MPRMTRTQMGRKQMRTTPKLKTPVGVPEAMRFLQRLAKTSEVPISREA